MHRLAVTVLLLVVSGIAVAELLPGKYRCYRPPSYEVTAWFELGEGQVRINGGAPQPVAYDATAARLDWPGEALHPWRHGHYFPEGVPDDGTARTTVLLSPQADLPKPSARVRLPRCYLTTH